MNTAVLNTYGIYNPSYPQLKTMGLTPSERDVFGKIASLFRNFGTAYIAYKAFAKELSCSRRTIGRAVSNLQKKQLLRKTGRKVHGFYPEIEILSKASVATPRTEMSSIKDSNVRESGQQCPTKYKTKNNLKKQTTMSVLSKNFAEKSNLIKKLKALGIGGNAATKLMKRFDLQRVELQTEHLSCAIEEGQEIKNPIGWLIKAIKNKYQPHKNQIEKQETLNADRIRTAQRYAQQAQHCWAEEKKEQAQKLAQKALQITPLYKAKELLEEIERYELRQKRRQHILNTIPKEQFEQVLEEEKQKQMSIFMRVGITKLGIMGERAAYEAAVDHFQNVAKQVQ